MSESEEAFWTFEGVEARLVETVRCWWRMPGGGHWPFASDGPWHLVKSELYGPDVDKDAPVRSLPLRRSEIAAMNEATEWVTWVPEDKRRVLVMALVKLAQGHQRVPWSKLLPKLGVPIGSGGLEWRYSQAVQLIANVLNARSGIAFAPGGRRQRYPQQVRDIVERLRTAENCGGNVSSPGIHR